MLRYLGKLNYFFLETLYKNHHNGRAVRVILTKYLAKEILKSQIAILFILLLIFFCQQLVRVLGSAASGQVPADLVISLLGLGMPTMAQLMLPICLFLALLLTFGRLYAESEITAMNACGLGAGLPIKVALILSVVTGILAGLNAFYLSPWAIQKQLDVLEEAKANPTMSALAAGQFISTNKGDYVLFIDKIENNVIQDVYVFQMQTDKKQKPSVVMAKQGELTALPNGDQILRLENSQRVEGSAMLPDFSITQFEHYEAYLGRQQSNTDISEIEAMSFNQLLSKSDNPAAMTELHWRITLVLAVPLMALIAVPLSRVNPRQGRFAKILPALLIYLIYFLLQSSLKSAGAVEKLDASFWIPIVNGAFLLLGLILNNQQSAFIYKLRQRLSAKGNK